MMFRTASHHVVRSFRRLLASAATPGLGLLLGASLIGCGAEAGVDDLADSAQSISIDTSANYTITNVHSNKCLQIAGNSSADLARLEIRSCNGSNGQRWRFEAQGSGFYRVRNVQTQKCLDVSGRSLADATPIIQYTCGSGTNQQFSLPDVSGGAVRLVARHSGKVVDLLNWGTTDGTQFIQWPWTGGANQQFRVVSVGGGGTTTPPPPPPTTGGSTTPGNGGVVNSTIIVRSGQTFDGRGLRYTAGSSLGDGSQSEDQKPVFRLESGSRLVNVVLGAPAADGIHTYGNVTLENIVWEDVGEDALTVKGSGTVSLNRGSAANGEDKIFQINAASTFRLSNFRANNAGKLIRQNGGTTFRVDVVIDACDISNMDEAIFRTDSGVSTVRMTNTRYHNIGDALFIGVSSGNITQSNNTQY